jgi:archaea-specific DNA-binding protein
VIELSEPGKVLLAHIRGRTPKEIAQIVDKTPEEVQNVISEWVDGKSDSASGLELLASTGILKAFSFRPSEKGIQFLAQESIKPRILMGMNSQHLPSMQHFSQASHPSNRGNIPPDTILIGKKPVMAYTQAVLIHFNTGSKMLTLKARGRAISTAVDVAEVVNNRFFQGTLSEEVHLGTEEIIEENGERRNVSTIQINLVKPT